MSLAQPLSLALWTALGTAKGDSIAPSICKQTAATAAVVARTTLVVADYRMQYPVLCRRRCHQCCLQRHYCRRECPSTSSSHLLHNGEDQILPECIRQVCEHSFASEEKMGGHNVNIPLFSTHGPVTRSQIISLESRTWNNDQLSWEI